MTIVVRKLSEVSSTQIEQLADVLIDCVDGGASVSFMSPLARNTAVQFWQRVASDAASGARVLLVAVDPEAGIVGTVHLVTDLPPNQPHRADVSKLLVHRKARRQGVALQLMQSLEQAALEVGRHVLVLDTVTGGPAARLYESLGFVRVGDIPDFALWPQGGYCSTTYFYKHLKRTD